MVDLEDYIEFVGLVIEDVVCHVDDVANPTSFIRKFCILSDILVGVIFNVDRVER